MQAGSCVWILPYSTLITPLAAAYGNNCWKPCFKVLFYLPSSMAFFTAIYLIQWVFWPVTSVSRSACSVCNFVLSDVLATLIKVSLSISFETLTSSKTFNKKQNRKIHHKEAKRTPRNTSPLTSTVRSELWGWYGGLLLQPTGPVKKFCIQI